MYVQAPTSVCVQDVNIPHDMHRKFTGEEDSSSLTVSVTFWYKRCFSSSGLSRYSDRSVYTERDGVCELDGYHLLLLALRERQTDGVLLSQGSQLLEELAEDDGAVDGVLHPQSLRLLLQAGRPSSAASAAPEQSAVQRLAAVSYVREGELSGVSSSRRAVGVTEDEVAEGRLSTFHQGIGASQGRDSCR